MLRDFISRVEGGFVALAGTCCGRAFAGFDAIAVAVQGVARVTVGFGDLGQSIGKVVGIGAGLRRAAVLFYLARTIAVRVVLVLEPRDRAAIPCMVDVGNASRGVEEMTGLDAVGMGDGLVAVSGVVAETEGTGAFDDDLGIARGVVVVPVDGGDAGAGQGTTLVGGVVGLDPGAVVGVQQIGGALKAS